MRRFVVILIVSNLLLCPFQCMGLLTGGNEDANPVCATCDCGSCRHSQEVPVRAPAVPARDQGCDSCQCVCGGAIFDKGPSAELTFAVNFFAVDFFAGDLDSVAALSLRLDRQADPFAGHSGLPSGAGSGRDLRVRLASLVC